VELRIHAAMTSRQSSAAPDGFDPTPEDREPSEYAGYLLQLAARFRESALDRQLAPLGLTAARCRVLGIVRRLSGCTMGELSFFSTIDRTTLTRIIDQLAAQGLVERSTPAGDRRKVTLALTAEGLGLHQRALATIAQVNRSVFAAVPETQLKEATRVLQAAVASVVTDPKERQMLLAFSRATEAP
jgi:DNA-binding MarR family transcriptional regulator